MFCLVLPYVFLYCFVCFLVWFGCLYVCLSVCLSVCLFVCLSVCLFVCLLACLLDCLVFLWFCLFVWLVVCLCLFVLIVCRCSVYSILVSLFALATVQAPHPSRPFKFAIGKSDILKTHPIVGMGQNIGTPKLVFVFCFPVYSQREKGSAQTPPLAIL